MKFLYFLTFILSFSTLNEANAEQYTDTKTIEKMNLEQADETVWQKMEYLPYEDVGFGNYIRRHKLDDGNFLILNGPSLKKTPRYIGISDDKNNIIKTIKDTYRQQKEEK